MPDRLHEQKHAVQQQRHDADELQLRGRIKRPWSGLGIVRQDQRDRRQRPQHAQRRGGALFLEALLMMPRAAEHQAQPDDAVQHQHHCGEHGIPRQRAAAVPGGQHHRNDQRDLDHRDGDGEHDRAERLAHPQRDDFGVMHGSEHGGQQQQRQPGSAPRARRPGRGGRISRPAAHRQPSGAAQAHQGQRLMALASSSCRSPEQELQPTRSSRGPSWFSQAIARGVCAVSDRNEVPECRSVVHVAQMRDLMRGHVVLDELGRHHQPPTERQRSVGRATAPTAGGVLDGDPRCRQPRPGRLWRAPGGQPAACLGAQEVDRRGAAGTRAGR